MFGTENLHILSLKTVWIRFCCCSFSCPVRTFGFFRVAYLLSSYSLQYIQFLHTYGVDHSQNWMLEKINFHWHSFNLNISWSGPCFVYMLRVTHHEIDLIQYFNMHYFAASYVHTYVSVWILLCEDFLFTLFELANSDTNKFFYK